MALAVGSRGSDVSRVQQALNALGARLSVDGIWGDKNQAADFQLGGGLSTDINGLVTASDAALQQGSRGDSVKYVQQALNGLGASLSVDGVWGDNTQAAYRRYADKLSGQVQAVIAGSATAPTIGAAGTSTLTYQPLTAQQLTAAAQALYQPDYNAQLGSLEATTRKSWADSILNAYSRGTQHGSYLGDTQASIAGANASAQQSLTAAYQSQILQYVTDAQKQQQQTQLEVEMYNAQLALEQQKLKLAQQEAARQKEQLRYQMSLL